MDVLTLSIAVLALVVFALVSSVVFFVVLLLTGTAFVSITLDQIRADRLARRHRNR